MLVRPLLILCCSCASYVAGFVGGLLLMAYLWRDRQNLAVSQSKNPDAVAQ